MYGRDTYGPKHTPLFVDGLNVNTHEPMKWIAPNDGNWILYSLCRMFFLPSIRPSAFLNKY
jgi:hypothetical protein